MIKVRIASSPATAMVAKLTCRYFQPSASTNHSDRYLRSSTRYPDRGVPVGPACWYCRPGSARLAPLRPCPSLGLWIYACANFPFLLSRHSSILSRIRRPDFTLTLAARPPQLTFVGGTLL